MALKVIHNSMTDYEKQVKQYANELREKWEMQQEEKLKKKKMAHCVTQGNRES